MQQIRIVPKLIRNWFFFRFAPFRESIGRAQFELDLFSEPQQTHFDAIPKFHIIQISLRNLNATEQPANNNKPKPIFEIILEFIFV